MASKKNYVDVLPRAGRPLNWVEDLPHGERASSSSSALWHGTRWTMSTIGSSFLLSGTPPSPDSIRTGILAMVKAASK